MKQRQEIVNRRQAGASLARIAREMQLPYATVTNLWYVYQKRGTLEPNYQACGKSEVRKAREIYEKAIALKGEHPTWGAGLIWVELAEEFEESQLPSTRTLQRWFHRGGVANEKQAKTTVAHSEIKRGKVAHEVWAVDAKETIRLGNGEAVSWMLISDEGSGAVLEAVLFPHQEME